MKGLTTLMTVGLAAGAAMAATVTPASAQSLSYASKVDKYTGGLTHYRGIESNALGAPQADGTRNFLSLNGGEAIFSFASDENPEGLFGSSVTIWETTWGHKSQQSDYDERVEVFVGNNLNDVESWLGIGEILNISDNAYDANQNDGLAGLGATLEIGNDNLYKYVRVVDQSNQPGDGFDVNAIAVNPAQPSASVPEPASVLGLVAAGGLLVTARRDRKQ